MAAPNDRGLTIENVHVDFPYEPYESQRLYMEAVIRTLNESTNALLESPTGTGKTLCLLAAACAWQQHKKSLNRLQATRLSLLEKARGDNSIQVPRIVYTTRTHSQISQVVKEFRKLRNRPSMAVLGSREQLCIHPEVSRLKGNAQNVACRALVKTSSCPYFTKTNMCREDDFERSIVEFETVASKKSAETGPPVLDIEDLGNLGQTKKWCPYYVSRKRQSTAEVVFMPYNYVIDPNMRRMFDADMFSNCIVIFDEAHNVPRVCMDAASIEVSTTLTAAASADISKVVQLAESTSDRSFAQVATDEVLFENGLTASDLVVTSDFVKSILSVIDGVPVPAASNGTTLSIGAVLEKFTEQRINPLTMQKLGESVEKITAVLAAGYANGTAFSADESSASALQTLYEKMQAIFSYGESRLRNDFRCYLSVDKDKGTKDKPPSTRRTLKIWCMNASPALNNIQKNGVNSFIFTSGTLAPLDSFEQEVGLVFRVRLENRHVIHPSQVCAMVVNEGPTGTRLRNVFKNRTSPSYLEDLGNLILNVARRVPNGILIFFPSYASLEAAVSFWTEKDSKQFWARLEKRKTIVVEPRGGGPEALKEAMEMFYTKATCTEGERDGAAFIAVCRGKVAEGLDFADAYGRAVIITGLPFPSVGDPHVMAKKEYQTQQAKEYKNRSMHLDGETWYTLEAWRAANQAIGRVIRHKDDFGAIILCDDRFGAPTASKYLSSWLSPMIRKHEKFGGAVQQLTSFVRENVGRMNTTRKENDIAQKPAAAVYTSLASSSSQDAKTVVTKLVPAVKKRARTSEHIGMFDSCADLKNEKKDMSLFERLGKRPRGTEQEAEASKPNREELTPEQRQQIKTYNDFIKDSLRPHGELYTAFKACLHAYRQTKSLQDFFKKVSELHKEYFGDELKVENSASPSTLSRNALLNVLEASTNFIKRPDRTAYVLFLQWNGLQPREICS